MTSYLYLNFQEWDAAWSGGRWLLIPEPLISRDMWSLLQQEHFIRSRGYCEGAHTGAQGRVLLIKPGYIAQREEMSPFSEELSQMSEDESEDGMPPQKTQKPSSPQSPSNNSGQPSRD